MSTARAGLRASAPGGTGKKRVLIDPELDAVVQRAGICTGCGAKLPRNAPVDYCPECIARSTASPDTGKDLQKAAKAELARRELARRHLIPFGTYMMPEYQVGWFQKDLAARLERFLQRVIDKQSPRMIINVPPRRGKTQLSSRFLPPWALGKYPWLQFIAATHSDYLAFDNSRDVLNLMFDERYSRIFPDTRLDPNNKGASGWRIDKHGGRYKPAGAGKGIAGYGAHIFLIDDPHKDREAFSETILDAIWRWYKSSVRTRLAPGGGIILIQTRWVLNDLTGRVLEEEGRIDEGGAWEYVVYPEEATQDEYRTPSGLIVSYPREGAVRLRRQGEVLDPQRWPPESNVEAKSDPVVWSALYQQNPVAGDAAMFKREWFPECYMKDIPDRLIKYSAWDTAVETRENSAFTVGLTGGVDLQDRLWLVDMLRERLDGMGIIEAILDQYELHRELETGIEKTNHETATKPFLDKRVDERGLSTISIREIDHGNRDKAMRARPIQAMARMGRVMVPRDAPWYEDFMREIEQFPVGVYKDIGDAFAHLGQMLESMTAPRADTPKAAKSWRDKLKKPKSARDWRAG